MPLLERLDTLWENVYEDIMHFIIDYLGETQHEDLIHETVEYQFTLSMPLSSLSTLTRQRTGSNI